MVGRKFYYYSTKQSAHKQSMWVGNTFKCWITKRNKIFMIYSPSCHTKTCMTLFLDGKTKGEIPENVLGPLFHAITMNGDWKDSQTHTILWISMVNSSEVNTRRSCFIKNTTKRYKRKIFPHTYRYTTLAGMFYMVALWHKQLFTISVLTMKKISFKSTVEQHLEHFRQIIVYINMEKTVFNRKVSEQYFDHSNKGCDGNTAINCGEMQ